METQGPLADFVTLGELLGRADGGFLHHISKRYLSLLP